MGGSRGIIMSSGFHGKVAKESGTLKGFYLVLLFPIEGLFGLCELGRSSAFSLCGFHKVEVLTMQKKAGSCFT